MPKLIRGKIRPTTLQEAITRAWSMVARDIPRPDGKPASPIRYWLYSPFNGGKDPFADHPADFNTRCKYDGAKTPQDAWSCDCVGFVAWCLGFDRMQMGRKNSSGKVVGKFEPYGGWINSDSMAMHAAKYGEWFEVIDKPEPGCAIVIRSKRNKKTGKRTVVGHAMLCVSVFPNGHVMTIDCSGSASRSKKKQAISAKSFKPSKRHVFLRYRKARAG